MSNNQPVKSKICPNCKKLYYKKTIECPDCNRTLMRRSKMEHEPQKQHTNHKTSNSYPNQQSNYLGIVVGAIIILLVFGYIFVSCSNALANNDDITTTQSEVRCWYCGKVIYNDGRPIHCKHKYLETWICDYCGKDNYIE